MPNLSPSPPRSVGSEAALKIKFQVIPTQVEVWEGLFKALSRVTSRGVMRDQPSSSPCGRGGTKALGGEELAQGHTTSEGRHRPEQARERHQPPRTLPRNTLPKRTRYSDFYSPKISFASP